MNTGIHGTPIRVLRLTVSVLNLDLVLSSNRKTTVNSHDYSGNLSRPLTRILIVRVDCSLKVNWFSRRVYQEDEFKFRLNKISFRSKTANKRKKNSTMKWNGSENLIYMHSVGTLNFVTRLKSFLMTSKQKMIKDRIINRLFYI